MSAPDSHDGSRRLNLLAQSPWLRATLSLMLMLAIAILSLTPAVPDPEASGLG